MLAPDARRTILVTGGTGAIGGAIVRALCNQSTLNDGFRRDAFRIVANYHRDEERADELQNETDCELWRADIGDEESVGAMFEAIGNLYGVIHAATISRDGLAANYRLAAWHETLRVNTTGAFLVTREALRHLPSDGRLLLFASRVGESGGAGQSAYAASKAAVIALTQCAAREAGGRIGVNAICPGWVPSSMNEDVDESRLKWQRARSVDGELGRVETIVSAVQWLLSESARGVSGQVIHCDARLW